jgi:hypothetical protein
MKVVHPAEATCEEADGRGSLRIVEDEEIRY